jgi:hypothetical protein
MNGRDRRRQCCFFDISIFPRRLEVLLALAAPSPGRSGRIKEDGARGSMRCFDNDEFFMSDASSGD